MAAAQVKRGRREWGDKDTYDFKLQCSGVWQDFMGMKFGGQQEQAGTECPSGEGTSGLKVMLLERREAATANPDVQR